MIDEILPPAPGGPRSKPQPGFLSSIWPNLKCKVTQIGTSILTDRAKFLKVVNGVCAAVAARAIFFNSGAPLLTTLVNVSEMFTHVYHVYDLDNPTPNEKWSAGLVNGLHLVFLERVYTAGAQTTACVAALAADGIVHMANILSFLK